MIAENEVKHMYFKKSR